MADHHGDPPVSPNKRKHIVWNEQNLMYNEQNKSAKMTIDEPDTPWASPPRELFEDPITEREGAAEDVAVAMDDVADRLRDMDDVGRGAVARPALEGADFEDNTFGRQVPGY